MSGGGHTGEDGLGKLLPIYFQSMQTKIIVYNDYNSYFKKEQEIGAITLEAGNPAWRHFYKLVEIYERR